MNKASKKVKKTDLSITALLIIGILAVVNFFSYQAFYRWDLTQNKIYSISDVSKQTASELDDVVNIKAYFSDNLPGQLISLKQEVADVLDEYQSYSNGNIRVEFVNPKDNEELQRELYMIGIPQLTFEVYEKDKAQLVNGYLGIAVYFEDNVEVIPAIKRNTSDLEYQLTTAIKKATSDEVAILGYLKNHGTKGLEEELSLAKKELEEIYTIRQIELTGEEAEIPPDIDTLVIAGASEEFSEAELRSIDVFLAKGNSLLLLNDGVRVEAGLSTVVNDNGLSGLLENYGVKLNNDLVADNSSNGVASFSQGFITFSSNYPFWPKITGSGFNQDNSAVASLENVILPWPSSLTIPEESRGQDIQATVLARTTENAWNSRENFNIIPQQISAPAAKQEFVLAASLSGELGGAYATGTPEAGQEGRVIVVGDSDFIGDNFIRNAPDNLTMFLNFVDILSLDDDLIKIRSKSVTSRPIETELSDAEKSAIRYLNVFLITALVVGFGLTRYFMRRRSRFVDEI